MKSQGYWDLNEQLLKDFGLSELYNQLLTKYGNNIQKAMTAAIVHYLLAEFSDESEELKLIIDKAYHFLNK